jgi:DNA-binding transcriptional LysR family regulator
MFGLPATFDHAMIRMSNIAIFNMAETLEGIPRDARHLVLFDEIYRSQSMTRAAEKLGLSQPTVSIWLGKLRRQLADPLFVRTSSGVRPTPRADALIGQVRETLALLHGIAGKAPMFNAASSDRMFRIAMTDASHITLLPRLLGRVRADAPGVGLEIVPISAQTPRALESGEADIAIGYIQGLEAGFHEQVLYAQDFVCLVNAQHPRIGATMTIRAYREEAHIGILSTTSYTTLQTSLARQRIRRRVLLELPGSLGLATIVASTDLIATVPRHIGETLAASGAIRVVPCPVKVAGFTVRQYWHERFHRDPGHRFLRSLCAELFSGGPRLRAPGDRARPAFPAPSNPRQPL